MVTSQAPPHSIQKHLSTIVNMLDLMCIVFIWNLCLHKVTYGYDAQGACSVGYMEIKIFAMQAQRAFDDH